MKRLLDENISPKLVRLLADVYPSTEHVRDLGLSGESDQIIWKYAQEHGHLLVSKDDDFRQRSFLHGAPPKVVWLQVGNAGTGAIATLLRTSSKRLRDFESEAESALLILPSSPL